MDDAINAAVKVLSNGLRDPGNEYNTSGAINVLLCLEGLFGSANSPKDNSQVEALVKLATDKAKKELAVAKAKPADFDKQYVSDLTRLIARVSKRLT